MQNIRVSEKCHSVEYSLLKKIVGVATLWIVQFLKKVRFITHIFLVDEEYYPNLYILLHIIYFDTSKKDKIDEHIDCSELMFSGSKANWKRSWYIYDCFIYSIKLNCCAMYHSSRVNRMICFNKFFNIYYCLFFNKNCT